MEANDELRERLFAYVRAAPGASTRQVATAAGLAESTTDYHLRRLVRAGRMTTQSAGRTRRWFVSAGNFCPVLKRAIPELRRPEAVAVARALTLTPASARDLAARTGMPEGTVRWVSAVLERAFLLERTANGRVLLREGAERCLEQACAATPCPQWGRCEVSLAWERERGREAPATSR